MLLNGTPFNNCYTLNGTPFSNRYTLNGTPFSNRYTLNGTPFSNRYTLVTTPLCIQSAQALGLELVMVSVCVRESMCQTLLC